MFKKILGVFCLLLAAISTALLIDTQNMMFIVEISLLVFFAFLLFRKKKGNTAELSEPVEKADGYVETDSTVYRADGQRISASEIPYLQQLDRERIRAKMAIPQHIWHIQESYQIMYDTADAETLCSRYKFAKGKVEELQHFFEQGFYSDAENLEKYQGLVSDANYEKLIVQCFARYMNKAHAELKTAFGIEKRKQRFLNYIRENVDVQIMMNLSIF